MGAPLVNLQHGVIGITVHKRAQELRSRLIRKKAREQVGTSEPTFIQMVNDQTDEAIIDSYITCSQCGARNLALEEALLLAPRCDSVDTWLLRTSSKGNHVH